MNDRELHTRFTRWQRRALLTGVIAALVSLIGLLLQSGRWFEGYLIAWVYWMAIAVGSLGLLLLQHLIAGRWSFASRTLFESGSATLPLMLLLFVPLIFGLDHLYVWTQRDVMLADPHLQHKAGYLSAPGFVIRTLIYFAVWIVFDGIIKLWAARRDLSGELAMALRVRRTAAIGLMFVGVAITFAAVDWVMSLEPHWFSTIFGAIYALGGILAAFCVVTLVTAVTPEPMHSEAISQPDLRQDLASLLLAFVMVWAYLAFSQYLIIWSGNLPEGSVWYLKRFEQRWLWMVLLVMSLHFVVPFFLLLSRDVKRSVAGLTCVTGLLLVLRFVDTVWTIAPSLRATGATLHWLDFVLVVAIGGLWSAMFLWQLDRRQMARAARLAERGTA